MPTQATTLQNKPKKFPTWLKVVLSVVLAAILFAVGTYLVISQATKGAVKVSDQLVADIQSGNADAAYTLTTATFQDETTPDQLRQIVTDISPQLQGKTHVIDQKIQKITGSPNQAVVIYSVDASAGKKYIRVVLQKNSSWQVINFRSSNSPLDTSAVD